MEAVSFRVDDTWLICRSWLRPFLVTQPLSPCVLYGHATDAIISDQGCYDTDALIDYLLTLFCVLVRLRIESFHVRRRTKTQKYKGVLFEQLESGRA